MILRTLVMNDSDGHNVQILMLEAREPQATITANPSVTPFIPDPSTLQPVPPSENNNSKAGLTKVKYGTCSTNDNDP